MNLSIAFLRKQSPQLIAVAPCVHRTATRTAARDEIINQDSFPLTTNAEVHLIYAFRRSSLAVLREKGLN